MRTFYTPALLALTGVVAGQLEAASGEFNITSPLMNGVYVAGQILPVTYYLTRDSSKLHLNIYLQPVGINYTTAVIAQDADVSENPSAVVTVNHETVWQHSYNYEIPPTAPAGTYQVIFESVRTHANTSIPITIRPFVSSASPMPSSTAVSLATSSSSTSSTPAKSSSSIARLSNDIAVTTIAVMAGTWLTWIL
ncbi:uncharacterized protein BYT42DRAFT_611669 [Radiomyces spectabilis]|uniref:uncharacterized protein n=1 Tax=Radiomyces spectabilis TaxID=64574 RepID=UPI00221F221B|nr:uncharacterized protein BYT42DRAFT_611669 [Radiomyces spectabilis]KAI8388650.1 hypothetical protein BYT42DRAFT_611669 [Radiomyces spectabilis]